MKIYCDESGYTGADLLEKNQPYFVFSGVTLGADDIQNIKELIYSNYPVQGEVKGRNLIQNDKGKNAIRLLFESYSKNAKIIYHDKKFALACKIFEYGIEPNLKSNYLAYESGFHKYIANGLYAYFNLSLDNAEHIFKAFLDTLRGDSKISLFDIDHLDSHFLIWWIFEIIKFDPQKFYNEINEDGKVSPLLLDLTTTSLLGILSEYGKTELEIEVYCDASNIYKNNSILELLNKIGSRGERKSFLGDLIGYKLKEDINIVKSKQDFGIQIADLFASTTAYCLNNKESEFSKEILAIVVKDCICNPSYCIVPDIIPDYLEDKINFYHNFMHLIWTKQRE